MKVVLATKNAGKIAEIKAILDVPGIEWLTYQGQADWPDVIEDGSTFLANATLKATALADHFDTPAMADDSGLEVEALGGRPGIHSARFAGPDAADADNVAKLLLDLRDVPEGKRGAQFSSVVVLAMPGGRTVSATGVCPGTIAAAARGEGGFGYDPVFLPLGYEKTMAELTAAEKNSLSHRGRALRRLRPGLEAEIK